MKCTFSDDFECVLREFEHVLLQPFSAYGICIEDIDFDHENTKYYKEDDLYYDHGYDEEHEYITMEKYISVYMSSDREIGSFHVYGSTWNQTTVNLQYTVTAETANVVKFLKSFLGHFSAYMKSVTHTSVTHTPHQTESDEDGDPLPSDGDAEYTSIVLSMLGYKPIEPPSYPCTPDEAIRYYYLIHLRGGDITWKQIAPLTNFAETTMRGEKKTDFDRKYPQYVRLYTAMKEYKSRKRHEKTDGEEKAT